MKKCDQKGGVHLTDLEANLVLFAFDDYFGVDSQGHTLDREMVEFYKYTLADAQKIRDKLFSAHAHPDEDDE